MTKNNTIIHENYTKIVKDNYENKQTQSNGGRARSARPPVDRFTMFLVLFFTISALFFCIWVLFLIILGLFWGHPGDLFGPGGLFV